MIRIGIGSWTLPWSVGFRMNPYSYPKLSPIDIIEYAASHAIHLVQLYNNVDLLALDTDKLRQIKEAADKNQIRLEIGGMGIEEEYLQDLLRVAELLGSHTIRTVITNPENRGIHDDVETVISKIQSRVSEFEKTGHTLLIENHDNYTSIEYKEILENINLNAIGVCFDPANNIGTLEHFRDSFAILKDYIVSVHYKEFSIERIGTKLGFIIEGCSPGEGENISKELFSLIDSLTQDVDVVLEQWVPYQGSVEETLRVEKEWAEKGIQVLKTQFIID